MINRTSSLRPIYSCAPARHPTPLETCHVCGSHNTWVNRWLDHVIPELDDLPFRAAWEQAVGDGSEDDQESDDPEQGSAVA